MGVYEFLYVTPRLRQLISDGGSELQLAALARAEGLVSLRRDALRKALDGTTTLEEVLRVTPEDQFLSARADGSHRGTRSASDPEQADAHELSPEQQRAIDVGAMSTARLLVAGGQDLLTEAREALPDGWTMATATSVHEALSRARTERIDLLLLDHRLNDGTAFDVLRPLRESDHDLTPAVVRRHGGLDEEELVDASVLGVTDHVEGELEAEELRARLEAALPN